MSNNDSGGCRFEIKMSRDIFTVASDCFEIGDFYSPVEIRENIRVVFPKGQYWVDYSPSRSEGEILLEYHVSDYSERLDDLAGQYKFYWTRYLSLPIGFVNDPRGFLKSYGAEILKENVA